MSAKLIRMIALISVGMLFSAIVAVGVVEHETLKYESPVRSIRGKLTGSGHLVPSLSVQVFDHGEVWLDDSIVPFEKKKKQNLVATAEPNEKGEFKVKQLPEGLYEAEFGNEGNGGYNVLSVLVKVDPKGAKDRLCVDVSLESAPSPRSSVRKCASK